MRVRLRSLLSAALPLIAAVSCGPPTLKPVASVDPGTACPGGWTSWAIDVRDRRVDPEGSEKLVALLRDSIVRSFPGCSWSDRPDAARPTVTIEVHRFRAPFEEGTWNAVADWTVWVRDPSGRTVTQFDAEYDVERPNYQGSNNEKESLQQVFDEALRRTLAGLRAVSLPG
jgi:hypothetical protein